MKGEPTSRAIKSFWLKLSAGPKNTTIGVADATPYSKIQTWLNCQGLTKIGIRRLRRAWQERLWQHLTQQTLAQTLHTRQSVVSQFERGKTNPSLLFLRNYAQALGKKIKISLTDWFVGYFLIFFIWQPNPAYYLYVISGVRGYFVGWEKVK